MVVQAIASKCLAIALIAATGVIALDESIEHGYTIPLVSDWYWDLESQLLDESLGPYDGNWKGFAVPTDEFVEDSNGETIECGGGYVQIRVYGTKISGTFFDSNGFGYQLSATLLDDGSVSDGTATGLENGGTWQGMFEETIVNGDWQDNYGCIGTWTAYPVSDMSQDVDEIHNETTSGNNTDQSDGNQDNQTNETNETGGQPNGNETALTNSSETDDEDTSFLENPVVKPLAKVVMGEPYESEPDPDGEFGETTKEIGTVAGIGTAWQVARPRKPKPAPGPVRWLKDTVVGWGTSLVDAFAPPTSAGLGVMPEVSGNMDKAVEIRENKEAEFGDEDKAKNSEEEGEIMDANYGTFGQNINPTPTDGNDLKEAEEMVKKGSKTVVVGYCSFLGGAIGGAIGSIFPGVGTAFGAAGGTVVGGSIGNWIF